MLVKRIAVAMLISLAGMVSYNFYMEIHPTGSDHVIDMAREARQHRDQEGIDAEFEFIMEHLVGGRPPER